MTRWSQVSAGAEGAVEYRERFAALEREGHDLHGEARLADALLREAGVESGVVLDAGCGFGRVAAELSRRGHTTIGVDADAHLVDIAIAEHPDLVWAHTDLARLDRPERFDLVVAAGNVVPYLADGTGPAVVERLSAHLRPGGLLLAGFGLPGSDLPRGAAEVPLATYDSWTLAAGLTLVDRWATWDHDPLGADPRYAVSLHRR